MADSKCEDAPVSELAPIRRKKIIARLDKVMHKAGKYNHKKSVAFENNFFNKAKTQKEYFRSAATLIVKFQKKIKTDSLIKKESSDEVSSACTTSQTDENWKKLPFRAAVAAKIEEAMFPIRYLKFTSAQKEKKFFTAAKSKDEYLSAASRFILSIDKKKEFYAQLGILNASCNIIQL